MAALENVDLPVRGSSPLPLPVLNPPGLIPLARAIGLTGMETDPHLHFEVLCEGTPLDPRVLLPAR